MSVNLAENPGALEELKKIGVDRGAPIVTQGERWVDGQSLIELAAFVGVPWTHEILPPAVLAERMSIVLAAAQRFTGSIPEAKLDDHLPGRPRPLRVLAMHIGDIVDSFLALVEQGKPHVMADLDKELPPHMRSGADLVAYQSAVMRHFREWWSARGRAVDYSADADVFYGKQTLHDFFERTTWHAAQHTRHLQYALDLMGIPVSQRLNADDLAGLPIPEDVWDR